MNRGNLYVIRDDGSQELLCRADMDGYSEIERECSVQEDSSSPMMHLSTELSLTINMGKEGTQSFHDVISVLPVPKAKRNDKIRKNFNQYIHKFEGRRNKFTKLRQRYTKAVRAAVKDMPTSRASGVWGIRT